jgi:hypothetical protein
VEEATDTRNHWSHGRHIQSVSIYFRIARIGAPKKRFSPLVIVVSAHKANNWLPTD